MDYFIRLIFYYINLIDIGSSNKNTKSLSQIHEKMRMDFKNNIEMEVTFLWSRII